MWDDLCAVKDLCSEFGFKAMQEAFADDEEVSSLVETWWQQWTADVMARAKGMLMTYARPTR